MFGGADAFFGADGDGLTLYFDVARFWNNLDFVMGLTMDELETMLPHSERIARREKP